MCLVQKLNAEYEASLSKANVDFNCICKSGQSSFRTVNKFKYIIQVKRCYDVPPVQAPVIEINQVQVPKCIDKYLEKRDKSFKKTIDRQLTELGRVSGAKKRMPDDCVSSTLSNENIKPKKRKIS